MILIRLASWILFAAMTMHLIQKFRRPFGSIAYWGLLVKILGVLALGLTYQYYYGYGDTLTLLSQVKDFNLKNTSSFSGYISALLAPIDPFSGNPRSIFFIRLMSPFGLLFKHHHLFLSIPLLLFSYWASWSFLMKVVPHYPKAKNLLIICFGFWPAYVFWSSGLLKDTLINGCLMFLCGVLISIYHTRKIKWSDLFLGILLFYLLFMTRHYLAGLFCIIAVLLLSDQWVSKYGLRARLAFFTTISLLGGYGIRFFFIRLRPERFPITFHELQKQIIAKSSAGSIIHFDLEPTWASLLANFPKSIVTGLFRPGIWEANSILQVFESIQTSILLIGLIFSLALIRQVRQLSPVVLAMILFVVILATLLPLSTPNFGSLSRYRVAFTPFLAFLMLYLPFRRIVSKDL